VCLIFCSDGAYCVAGTCNGFCNCDCGGASNCDCGDNGVAVMVPVVLMLFVSMMLMILLHAYLALKVSICIRCSATTV
jgi:hypothetical protein